MNAFNDQNQQFALSNYNYVHHMVEAFQEELALGKQCLDVIAQLPKGSEYLYDFLGIKVKWAISFEAYTKLVKSWHWRKVYERSNVAHYLSYKEQEKWKTALAGEDGTDTLPEFTYESITSTIQGWFENTESYFIDRVDSVFTDLSTGHLTNHPNGFNRKMVFNKWWSQQVDHNYGRITDYRKKAIHDLRCVIAVVNGLPVPEYSEIHNLVCKLPYKTKIEFDHGLWTAQIFKNGNLHIWVEEETAILLNSYLAKKYPNTLATRDMPKKKADKTFTYFNNGIDGDLQNALIAIRNKKADLVNTLKPEISKKIQKYFSATAQDLSNIDNSALINMVDDVLNIGLPDIKTYQYYPTPSNILSSIEGIVAVDQNTRILEPSAGSGAIAQLYPENVECFEICESLVSILKAKGLKTTKADFLKVQGNKDYDKIIMNPPYSLNRCLMHIEHAFNFIKEDGEIYVVAPSGMFNKIQAVSENFHYNVTELEKFEPCFEDTKILTTLYLIS